MTSPTKYQKGLKLRDIAHLTIIEIDKESFAGRIAILMQSRVAGRTLGLRGPEVARPCPTVSVCEACE